MPPPKLSQLNLVVTDMPASVAFYRRLGLVFHDRHPLSAHHVEARMPNGCQLDLDSVAFAKKWDAGLRVGQGGGRVVLTFEVPTREVVDEVHADLVAAGHTSQQAPYDAFWGARFAIVEDPDGNPVGLMSPIDPKRTSAPPVM